MRRKVVNTTVPCVFKRLDGIFGDFNSAAFSHLSNAALLNYVSDPDSFIGIYLAHFRAAELVEVVCYDQPRGPQQLLIRLDERRKWDGVLRKERALERPLVPVVLEVASVSRSG